jgi:hypothetical protein
VKKEIMNNGELAYLRGEVLKAERTAPNSPATRRLAERYQKAKAARLAAWKAAGVAIGRPRIIESPQDVHFGAPPDMVMWLDAQPGSRAETVRDAVREKMERAANPQFMHLHGDDGETTEIVEVIRAAPDAKYVKQNNA